MAFKKGNQINKGRKPNAETKKKMSLAHIGNKSNKGRKLTEEHKENIKKKLKGRIPWNKGLFGDKSPTWKGGKTSINQIIRMSARYRLWRNDIYHRDNFTCKECKQRGYDLNVHHLVSFAYLIKQYDIQTMQQALSCQLLWDLDNGITLCLKCHEKTNNYKSKKEE